MSNLRNGPVAVSNLVVQTHLVIQGHGECEVGILGGVDSEIIRGRGQGGGGARFKNLLVVCKVGI